LEFVSGRRNIDISLLENMIYFFEWVCIG